MKTTSHFSRIFIMLTMVTLSFSMALSQELSDTSEKRIPAPLRIAVATYDCINGGSVAVVYHPIQGFVFDSRRYQVVWYDNTGKLVSGQVSTNSCICGTTLTVVVRDFHTSEVKSMRVRMHSCNDSGDDDPVQLTAPDLSNN